MATKNMQWRHLVFNIFIISVKLIVQRHYFNIIFFSPFLKKENSLSEIQLSKKMYI